jgi:hypothetical protein
LTAKTSLISPLAPLGPNPWNNLQKKGKGGKKKPVLAYPQHRAKQIHDPKEEYMNDFDDDSRENRETKKKP